MNRNILREITTLTQGDCFTLLSRTKTEFDFPLHYHEEFELNFISNGTGAKRVVGDHMEEINCGTYHAQAVCHDAKTWI